MKNLIITSSIITTIALTGLFIVLSLLITNGAHAGELERGDLSQALVESSTEQVDAEMSLEPEFTELSLNEIE